MRAQKGSGLYTIMVTQRGPSYSGFTSLDVEILILTVNGRTPSASQLKPFLTGKLVTEPNNSVQRTAGKPAVADF
jgi:hypothetical protein